MALVRTLLYHSVFILAISTSSHINSLSDTFTTLLFSAIITVWIPLLQTELNDIVHGTNVYYLLNEK